MKLKTLAVAVTAATISSSAFALDFNGYFRAGFGLNADGGSQYCYGDGGPNAHVVGRLGDECDTYAELSLSQNVVERNTGEKFSIHTLVAYGTQEGNTDQRGNSWQGVGEATDPWSGQRLSFREAYAKYTMASGTEIWAGNRYYGRKDVHINDWYYVNGSGYGAGVDSIDVGFARLGIAVRHNKWHDVAGGADSSNPYTSTPQLDVRLSGIDIGLGSIDLIAMGGKANLSDAQEDATTEGSYNDKTGVQLTAEWAVGLPGGFNKLVAQYSTEGYGWSGYGMNNHLGDSYNVGGGGDLGRKSWRIIDHGVVKFGSNVDMGWSAFYSQLDQDDAGDNNKSDGTRYGVTLRPRYLWNNTMSTILEAAYYNAEDPWMSESQDLNKVALAQAWSPLQEKGGFWARPEIRIFVAKFGGDMAQEKNDLMYGAQVEAWW
ncbi:MULTISPECIES: carbohydrate porin [unclassified Agarivorans]|uniref:carbohydrate porin n=1 Tax=unclassified Agarivorans TaxID=2636026 RepID=UPI0026E2032C|nr:MULTISPECIES: carbohydrate porin [unclassified Agarivorans]MDO6687363.1 carbohydrate porin [Agarivorans sp. 3_MG-2023]MDO6717021.1 carbohydrate porin [Agarivorans sp. 2_MG-2023]